MKIKFKNGNIIESIESSESKRSRGYRNLVTFVDDMWDYSISETDWIYYKLACFYQAKTELYDRTLTNLRERYDPTSAYIIGENRKHSTLYASKLFHQIIEYGCVTFKIPKSVFISNFKKCLNINLSAQGWIDTYEQLVKEGEMEFLDCLKIDK